jgi:hypothetical protein
MFSLPYHLGPTGGINQISQTSGFERAVVRLVMCVAVTVCRKVPLSNCTVTLQPEPNTLLILPTPLIIIAFITHCCRSYMANTIEIFVVIVVDKFPLVATA